MPVAGFNVGKETNLEVVHPTLGPIPLGLVQSFESRPVTQMLKSIPITNGGKSISRVVYTGWEGNFEMDRANGVLDTLFAVLEETYYGGGPETYFLLSEIIRNPDGTIEEYRYINVVVQPETHGQWKAEDKVTQRFNFAATLREKA